MTKIISIYQQDEWTAYVNKSINYDFYHSWTFHSLEKTGEPFLFIYEEFEDFIALPLLKRAIPDSDFYDLSSAYGYGGPITNKKFEDLHEHTISNFKYSLLNYLKEGNIISIFCRLHPFFNQKHILKHFGGIWDNGKVIAIDLSMPVEVQRAKYPKVYSKIRQLKRKGYYLKEANTIEDINTFISIYESNMSRVHASDSYLFDQEYFISLLSSKEFEAKLYFVYNENKLPVCGTIIVFTNKIIQGYLLATREEYRGLSPAKLLVDEVSMIGRQKGMKYYNLGGGFGYKEDTLYNWKLTFSYLTLDYKSWRYIVDHKAYYAMLQQLAIDPETNIDYFPLYRFLQKT